MRQSITGDPQQQTATDADVWNKRRRESLSITTPKSPTHVKIQQKAKEKEELKKKKQRRNQTTISPPCSVAYLVLRDIYNRSGMSFLFLVDKTNSWRVHQWRNLPACCLLPADKENKTIRGDPLVCNYTRIYIAIWRIKSTAVRQVLYTFCQSCFLLNVSLLRFFLYCAMFRFISWLYTCELIFVEA